MSEVYVAPATLSGSIKPPPSKSDAHRALIASWLADSRYRVRGLPSPMSADLAATEQCLRQLLAAGDRRDPVVLDCGESGSTLRFIIPLAAALGQKTTFTGHGRLPRRPLAEYQSILSNKGISLSFPEDTTRFLPLKISGQLVPGKYEVPGHISSQYLSGLLFALPLLNGPSEIMLTSQLMSAAYVDMTIATLNRYGIRIQPVASENNFARYNIQGNQRYQPASYQVETDYSQAAFWYAAEYMGHPIHIEGLSAHTLQGDRVIIDILKQLADGSKDYQIDASQIPDLVPILAVAAAVTSAKTSIHKAERLRLKESDRLQAICDSLYAIGADIEETDDGLLIYGGSQSRRKYPLSGGRVKGYHDHRIVMAMAIAALATKEGIHITDAEAVNKSYPHFFQDLQSLGGIVHGFNLG